MKSIKQIFFLSSFVVLMAAPAFANVTVASPYNGEQVSTPFTLSASASACSSQAISAMGYSFDNSTNTTIVSGSAINTSVQGPTGSHTLHVKSWGTGGASCVTDVAINVTGASSATTSSSAATTGSGITISSPSNGQQVSSSFALSASASTCSSQTITAMGYSLDNSTNTTIVDSTSINATVQASAGSHTLHVKSWGNQGGACSASVAITVAGAVTAVSNSSVVPSGAASVSSIQVLSNWKEQHDPGTSGSSSGSMSLVSSPAYSGNSRKFVTNFSGSGGELYDVDYGDDTSATNFFYDGWVYIGGSASSLANIEMDMNQVMSNGQTVIFGFQCDGWSGTWDYTENAGSPTKPVDTWVHSGAGCNPRNWSANTWHHVQVYYSRNSSGTVTYHTVWLDGSQQAINGTVNSAFALGWAPSLITNFQIDGSGNGSATVYLDDLTISRW